MKVLNNQKQIRGNSIVCGWHVDKRESLSILHLAAENSETSKLICLDFQASFFGDRPERLFNLK